MSDLSKLSMAALALSETVEELVVNFYDIQLRKRGSSWDEETKIDPKDFLIPEEQWKELCQHAIDLEGQQGGLTWMNIGPSTHV